MNLNQLIIAFLAPRDPAAYPVAAIAQRLNASHMLDRRCTEDAVHSALCDLHRLGLVGIHVNQLDDNTVWQITPDGAREWARCGRVTVV